jgi:hypothetical protein
MEEEVVENSDSSVYRQELRNKIIAVGLNSLANAWGDPDKELLSEFVTLSLKDVLPTWSLLSDKVRFQIFVNHIGSFRAYMEEEIAREES